jgi:hypothetical protein
MEFLLKQRGRGCPGMVDILLFFSLSLQIVQKA